MGYRQQTQNLTSKTSLLQNLRHNQGANFRNLPGVLVGPDQVVKLDETIESARCTSGKPLGANFRNLPRVLVGSDRVVKLDETIERARCTSCKPLVLIIEELFDPLWSFGRLGMDYIVATVVTRPEHHNQVLLHPNQDRVLYVRENARLQGFPDRYKLFGPVRERYMQIGNTVSFSVSMSLGYCLEKALQGAQYTIPAF
ncbi:DNA (cytosine-5)-methyltransferase CMT3-like [Salvia hispanica]|uniref:DNA (cytosine-5)-methyltransferase CMT3-like n=1 Tax=Salvia hispanica TaxID=49212 RepID=UPI0020094361|nr:DNA (cytosine-5)-methyltransferase CMT3-like [Salvia hispanica]